MTTNPFKKLLSDRQVDQQPEETDIKVTPPSEPIKNQRGRPATGKRSDPDWIGRTYYIKKALNLFPQREGPVLAQILNSHCPLNFNFTIKIKNHAKKY